MSIDIEKRAPLQWDEKNATASLDVLYEWVEEIALEGRAWYIRKKKWPAIVSRATRAGALVLLALGGIVPLLTGFTVMAGYGIEKLGYVALGLAAAALLFDQHGSFSASWMRYITTHMKLTRLIRLFQIDWQMARARFDLEPGAVKDPGKIAGMLALLREFLDAVLEEVENETEAWVVEFRSSLAQLQRAIKQKEQDSGRAEPMRTGTVAIEVGNFARYPAVSLFIDDTWYGKMAAAQQTVTLFGGQHEVAVRALNDKHEEVSDKAAVAVVVGEQRTAKLTLPGDLAPKDAPKDDVNLMKAPDVTPRSSTSA